jgi:aspartokinase
MGHLERRVRALERSGAADAAAADEILCKGEQLAAEWFAARLASLGMKARAVDAAVLGVRTEGAHGAARIDVRGSRRAVRSGLSRVLGSGRVPVITGFFGRAPDGTVATLGRGGSDYSAAALGAILDAPRVELVKQPSAVRTADPRWVPDARPVPWLSFRDAGEMARIGGQLLHPRTTEPLRSDRVELAVRSLADPGAVTVISRIGPPRPPPLLTFRRGLVLLRVRARDGAPDVVRNHPPIRAALTLRKVEVVEVLGTSGVEAVVVRRSRARHAVVVLAQALGDRWIVERPVPIALIGAVLPRPGHGSPASPGLLGARVLAAHRTARHLLVAVPARYGPTALRRLHRALVLPLGKGPGPWQAPASRASFRAAGRGRPTAGRRRDSKGTVIGPRRPSRVRHHSRVE